MVSGVFLFDHLGSRRLIGHRPLDRELGRFVVVLLDLRVVFGQPVDEDTTDDDQFIGLVLRNGALSQAVGDRLGNALLGRAKHLDSLTGALDRHLADHHCCGLDGEVRLEHRQQIAVAFRLTSQRVGKRDPHRTALVTDQQIDVCNFISFARQGFTNIKRHLGCLLDRCDLSRSGSQAPDPVPRYLQAL